MPSTTPRIKGALAPVVTPFKHDLQPDHEKFVDHCKWLIANDVGLAIFGTNSEATSLSLKERLALTESLLEAGVPPQRMMPGTGCCSLPETVELTRHAVQAGAAGVLMLPPFYYKGVSDNGLFNYFSEVIERVASDDLRLYLYHFPAVSQIPLSVSLVEKLLHRYPTAIAGLKDSSGDWNSMKAYIDNFSQEGFDVFPGTESYMLDAVRIGGAGCISATCNVNPAAISSVYRNRMSDDVTTENEAILQVRQIFQRHALIPAMKSVIANSRQDPLWTVVRPPLESLPQDKVQQLLDDLSSVGFSI
ncbi:MAG: dihydrodipicolinate synthase family protein [Burkholderiaceae bacterium]|nr:dihydrodipicolinate synthase family protein [Burkholderiaceae bacterium]